MRALLDEDVRARSERWREAARGALPLRSDRGPDPGRHTRLKIRRVRARLGAHIDLRARRSASSVRPGMGRIRAEPLADARQRSLGIPVEPVIRLVKCKESLQVWFGDLGVA